MNVSLLCPTCDHIRNIPAVAVVILETPEETTERWFRCPECGLQCAVIRDQRERENRRDAAADDIEDNRVQWLMAAGATWIDLSVIDLDLTEEA